MPDITSGSINTGKTTTEQITAEALGMGTLNTVPDATLPPDSKTTPPVPPVPDGEKTYTQADLDKAIIARLERERKNTQAQIDKAVTEAQKLAKMSADERLEHEKQEREKALLEREQGITKRELRAQALEMLGERGLPRDLADVLPYADADSTKAALESVEKVFRNAVEKAVTERLRANPPKIGQTPPAGGQESLADELYSAMYKLPKT